jgi:hypothetical protein
VQLAMCAACYVCSLLCVQLAMCAACYVCSLLCVQLAIRFLLYKMMNVASACVYTASIQDDECCSVQ